MSNVVDFETTSENFQNSLRIDSVSHCDKLEITNNCVVLIEETVYIDKNLIDKNIYRNEISELIKKMWGSLSVFSWYFSKHQHLEKVSGKDRIFILFLEEENPKTIRMLGNLMKALRKYRNSSFSDVMYKIKKRREHER
jgi:predicted CopG family antitoxin